MTGALARLARALCGDSRRYLGLAAIVVLCLLPLVVRNPFYAHILIMMFFYASLGLAWNIIGGFAGQLSFGHAAFFGVGAYTSSILSVKLGVSPWLALFAAGGMAAATAAAVSYPCFRLRGPFFALSTIAVAEVLRILAIYFKEFTEGSVGILIPFKPGIANLMFRSKVPYAYFALLLMAAVFAVSWLIEHSRLGYSLLALREDEDAAEALGVNATECKLIAAVLSGFFTGLAGCFSAQYVLFIEPFTEFSLDLSIMISLTAMIGGLGTSVGPILGAFLLTPLQELLRAWLGGQQQGLHLFIYGTVLVVCVILLPNGLITWLSRRLLSLLRHLPAAAAE